MKKDYDLFYVCSLIEYICRQKKLKRNELVNFLGEETLKNMYEDAPILHCEQIEKIADEYITYFNIQDGDFDNISKCKYSVPDYWTIGDIFRRLIQDVQEENESIIKTLINVYSSWICDAILDFETAFYYQSREQIACYYKGEIV